MYEIALPMLGGRFQGVGERQDESVHRRFDLPEPLPPQMLDVQHRSEEHDRDGEVEDGAREREPEREHQGESDGLPDGDVSPAPRDEHVAELPLEVRDVAREIPVRERVPVPDDAEREHEYRAGEERHRAPLHEQGRRAHRYGSPGLTSPRTISSSR